MCVCVSLFVFVCCVLERKIMYFVFRMCSIVCVCVGVGVCIGVLWVQINISVIC